MTIILQVDDSYAVVGGREDLDGALPKVTLEPNRNERGGPNDVQLAMTPAVARKVARKLNRWARLVDQR